MRETEINYQHAKAAERGPDDYAAGGCLVALAMLPLTLLLAALGIRKPQRNRPRSIREVTPDWPRIVCLCGSTRFVDEFNRQRKTLTEAGEIVLSIEVVTTQARQDDPQHANPELKARLDALHLRKIDLADYVLFLNVGGYMGESTRRELAYARASGKEIRFLESEAGVRP
jgi:hypothetical protein